MHVPSGMTQADCLAVIERVAKRLAPRFTFGYFTVEDITQEARLFAMEALPRFDPSIRPLEAFLVAHLRNRLINFKRNLYHRADVVCAQCGAGSPCGPDGQPCKPYLAWARRNAAKANLAKPSDLDGLSDAAQAREDGLAEVETRELLRIIDENLAVEFRADWLRLRDGVKVPKARRKQVEAAIRLILTRAGVNI